MLRRRDASVRVRSLDELAAPSAARCCLVTPCPVRLRPAPYCVAAAAAAVQAGKFLNKLGKKIQANMAEGSTSPSGGSVHRAAAAPLGGRDAAKVQKWGNIQVQSVDPWPPHNLTVVHRIACPQDLVAGQDGSVWVAYSRGLVEQLGEGGKRLAWYELLGGASCLAGAGRCECLPV
jgi:hypothetical protein